MEIRPLFTNLIRSCNPQRKHLVVLPSTRANYQGNDNQTQIVLYYFAAKIISLNCSPPSEVTHLKR
jgi:hypothetical protein